jgi:hypothetical protein
LWLYSYFTNSNERVLITNNHLKQNNFSTWEEIKHIILQGTEFGPLFPFLIYMICPELQTVKTIPIMSADDTSILVTGTNK